MEFCKIMIRNVLISLCYIYTSLVLEWMIFGWESFAREGVRERKRGEARDLVEIQGANPRLS